MVDAHAGFHGWLTAGRHRAMRAARGVAHRTVKRLALRETKRTRQAASTPSLLFIPDIIALLYE
jgi:hypothetical protein